MSTATKVRRRASTAREIHYAQVLEGTMDLEAFRRVQLAEAVAPWGELPPKTLAMCLTEREANLERRRLVSGARELIDRLRAAGLRVGLLTNGPSALQRRKLAVTGLDRLLDAVAISAEIGVSRPDALCATVTVPTALIVVCGAVPRASGRCVRARR